MLSNVSVSVVLFKTPVQQILMCLDALFDMPLVKSVCVVDNSPTDVLGAVVSRYDKATYFHFPSNPGYGRAHNKAIEFSKKFDVKYHLIINSDVLIKEDVLSPMVEYMDKFSDVGHMMPKVLNMDGSVQRLCKLVPTPMDLFLRRFYHLGFLNEARRKFELHDSGYEKIMFVPYLSGCFMLIRHQVLDEIGAFDERFFMYPEDIDLTRRIAEKYKTLFFPNVSVYHEHGAASYKSFRMFLIHSYNIFKYFNKWGWFNDSKRDFLNKKTLNLLRSL